ncbi:MAG: dehydrogenase E1 component subunit alpha/beta [Bacteroidia bacterium]|nr:dehydrogenase E1 component subunit alpha/beta [Bacteroidia bacterium]
MEFKRKRISDKELLQLYHKLLWPRLIEEKMLILLRQGRISKWFSGIGQEAISVGLTQALQPDDYILPLHRNLGVFTTRDIPLKKLICQWLGKPDGFTSGRDRSFHFGSMSHHVIGMISHLGAMLPVADGLALASRLDGKDQIAVAFSGDGGTSEGDFHEALNVAAVWDLPVIFVIENNGYGLSTPSHEQYRAAKLADRARGYGMKGLTIDGNNVLEVFHTVQRLRKQMGKNPKPVLLECQTFRMRGHEEASGTKYVPKELMEEWGKKDPILNFENWLKEEEILDDNLIEDIRKEMKVSINEAVEEAFHSPEVSPKTELEMGEVFRAFQPEIQLPSEKKKELRFVDAIQESLDQSMERHQGMVIMGQDIADYGGVFKITEGFVEKFGKERVRNTPICESAIVGAAMGLALAGRKAVMEMQFADFVSCGFNQIVNNLAKTHYRWGEALSVVVRMPTGAGVGAGPYHSQSNEAWFTQVPGLKVLYPSSPSDAKGLLNAAIEDPNPVLFFEHKALYRSLTEEVPEDWYQLPLGKASIVNKGEDLTIVSYGLGVHWVKEILEDHKGEIELIDLRSLVPWDKETVFDSVRKTGKCLVLVEDSHTGSFGAELAASISEECFQYLDGPVQRLSSLDTPIPFHKELEKQYLPQSRLREKVDKLLAY